MKRRREREARERAGKKIGTALESTRVHKKRDRVHWNDL